MYVIAKSLYLGRYERFGFSSTHTLPISYFEVLLFDINILSLLVFNNITVSKIRCKHFQSDLLSTITCLYSYLQTVDPSVPADVALSLAVVSVNRDGSFLAVHNVSEMCKNYSPYTRIYNNCDNAR